MARKISCFVSFSASDGSERDVRFLIQTLSERVGHLVSFKAYFDQRSGMDLSTFMENEIRDADAAIALFSPDYKHKADQGIPSGVRTEFVNIVDRLEHPSAREFLFIPVYWRGTSFDAAAPEFFRNHEWAQDLHIFQAFGARGQAAYLPDRISTLAKSALDKICEDLEGAWDRTEPEFPLLEEQIERTLLGSPDFSIDEREINNAMFIKQERTSISIQEFSEKLFVKTRAYTSINTYHQSAFTGRKGSGKTTLVKLYKYRSAKKYFSAIDVEVNDWKLHVLLRDGVFRMAEADLSFITDSSQIFDFIWPVFLGLSMVRSLEDSGVAESHRTIPNQQVLRRYVKDKNRYERLFQLSIDSVRLFFQSRIQRTKTQDEAAFRAELMETINVEACTEWIFGRGYRPLLDATRSDHDDRRFLFCLDRFDTEIQKYRKEARDQHLTVDEINRREVREIYWIQGLVELIDHLRSPDFQSNNQSFYKAIGPFVDFCVPLPRDRLYEVQQRRRDSIVGDNDEEISWGEFELLTLLRKRLQLVWKIDESQIDKGRYANARARFDRVLQISQRRIPTTVPVSINGKTYEIDTFLNVLRHSFYRPRDILILFAPIMTSVEAARKRRSSLSARAVAAIVTKTIRRLIEEEFVGEFIDTIKNIKEILKVFVASPQIMSWEEFRSRINPVNFEMYGGDDVDDIERKVQLLFDIGFVGARSASTQVGNFPTTDFRFAFVGPNVSADLSEPALLPKLEYAIHPLFIEYLKLTLGDHPPVLMLNWADIESEDYF